MKAISVNVRTIKDIAKRKGLLTIQLVQINVKTKHITLINTGKVKPMVALVVGIVNC